MWVTTYDAAVFLALHEYFTTNPLPENANPVARWQGLWNALYKCGDITRAFDPKRFAFLRNLISDEGGVEWIDRQYIPGSKDEGIKGKCCKWKASDDMMDLMAEYSAGTGGSVIVQPTHAAASTLGALLNPMRLSGPNE